MIYIPTRVEKEQAAQFIQGLINEGLKIEKIPLNELLAMYAKHKEGLF